MAWPLKVETDEPGRRLVLSAEVPSVSKGLLAGIAGFIVLLVAIPTLGTAVSALVQQGVSTHTLVGLALGAFYPAAAVVGLAMMARRVRAISRLAIDRPAGRIEIREFRLVGRTVAPEIIRMDNLLAMNVRAVARFPGTARELPGGARAGARDLALTLRLLFREGVGLPPRELRLAVEGIDRMDEGSDLALRLASAAGLDHQRVVLSDPRTIEMEFSDAGAPGFTPLAETVAKADYNRDRVSEQAHAIAARETIPPFDPASFQSDYRLETWEPGREVRFHKPRGLAAIGCAPGLLFFLTAPVVFVAGLVASPDHSIHVIAGALLFATTLGVFGLVPAGLALLVVWTSAAKTVVVDWTERRLKRRRPFSRTSHEFSELRAIELMRVKVTGKHSASYYCRLHAQLAMPGSDSRSPESIEIVSTNLYPEPDTSYRMALPLATELAKALGVPRVVTDYN